MPQPVDAQPTSGKPRQRYWVLLATIFAILYGALLSRQWVAGTPDSEYYLAIARNLAAGMGFVWDGRPVLMVPPAWPFFLAGAMKVSSSMLLLNLVPYLCSLAGLVLWYFVLEKVTSPRRAFFVMVLVGVLFNYHRFAQHFYSEALFMPLLAGTLLLAFRVRRGAAPAWQVAALLALCCSLVLVRWAAVFYWPIIAAVCFSTQPWHRQRQAIVVAVLAGVALAGTFVGTRKGMEVYASGKLKTQVHPAASATEPAAVTDGDTEARTVDEAPDLQWHSKRTKTAMARARQNWGSRVVRCGQWLPELYWPPAQVAQSGGILGLAVNGIGLLLWGLVLLGTGGPIRRREWMWLGLLVFCAAMVLFSGIRGRYLTPAVPLLLLATLQGIDVLRDTPRHRLWKHVGGVMLYGGLGSVALCNLLIWATSTWALHSNRFGRVWCGGDHSAIVSISDFLATRQARDGEIAVSRNMENFGRQTVSDAATRLVHLLTARRVLCPPAKLSQQPPDERLTDWARKNGVKYYVHRPPITPWRLSHFRLAWLQERMTGRPAAATNPSFVLYELVDGRLREVTVPYIEKGITVVPGL